MLKDQKGGIVLIIVFIVLLITVAGGASFLGTRQKADSDLFAAIPSPLSSVLPLVSPSPSTDPLLQVYLKTGDVPQGWLPEISKTCDELLFRPPPFGSYVEYIDNNTTDPEYKRSWKLLEGTYPEPNLFEHYSMLTYQADIEASGMIAGRVEVSCFFTNINEYSLDNIAEKYAESFKKAGASIKVKSKRSVTILGKDAIAAVFEGGMFSDNEVYFLIYGGKVLKITKTSNSPDTFIRVTTDQIFNSIQFIDPKYL